MGRKLTLAFSLPLVFLLIAQAQSCVALAFPGAEGFGSQASGGRAGEVYIVTNLNDDGPGSLRYGLETASAPRTIVFEVGGTIHLEDHLRVRDKSNLTLAGQTAPGDGILLRGGMLQFRDCENLIVRHIRVRYGWDTGEDQDAIWITDSQNMILDHVSASWGMDETFSMTNDTSLVTVQRCLIAEGVKEGHQYGMLIDSRTPGGGKISLIGNLFINHEGRMPRANSGTEENILVDMANNVLYNWSTGGDWGTLGTALNPDSWSNLNFINNYSIAGRNTGNQFFRDTILRGGDGDDEFYISGNKLDSNVDGVLDGFEASWDHVRGSFTMRDTPFVIPAWASVRSLTTADDALCSAIEDVGAIPWSRDSTDLRLIDELTSYGTQGLVVTRLWYPEWPVLEGGAPPVDSDRDGMPDDWEEERGLNPEDLSDSAQVTGEEGYTHLEEYLNWLVRPTVSLGVDRQTVREGETAEVHVTRTGYTDDDLAVYYEVSGDASPEVDYNGPGLLTLLRTGEKEAVIPIHALLDDEPYERNESVRIRLLEDPKKFRLGDLNVSTVEIENQTPAATLWRVR